MKNILLTYFESVYTLDAFLAEINLKLTDRSEQERLKQCVRNLSSVIVAFDFKLTGPFKSYVDKRFTYEQLLFLCFVKINESAAQEKFFDGHMFKTSTSNPSLKNVKANLSLSPQELEKRLASTENLSICYFLSRQSGQNVVDGDHWRELFNLIGCSITKYILIYSYLFRKAGNNTNVYVQISGPKFNQTFKSLIQQKLESDEAMIKEKIKQSVMNRRRLKPQPLEEPRPAAKSDTKPAKLNTVFEAKDEAIKNESLKLKTVEFQLDKLGHQKLNKTSILYDRYLGSRMSNRLLYSNLSLEPNETTSQLIMTKFIFDKIDMSLYTTADHVNEMKGILNKTLTGFIKKYRSCPFKIFLHFYCEETKEKVAQVESIELKSSTKRKLNGEEIKKTENEKNSLRTNVKAENVYKFVRRCLIYTLNYDDKLAKQKLDLTCPLVGGKQNFKRLLKHLKLVICGLKYDSFSINTLLHGLKFSRIAYLKPVQCHKYKRLVLMALLRWLFEDYIFMLIRAYFYVTDTAKTNYELFYYLKSDWKLIIKEQLSERNYRTVYNLEKIRETDLASYCSRYESSGAHMGRLLPKNVNNECRVISGCRCFNPCTKKSFNVNYRFITLNNCLKWLINKDPSLVGFACNGHNEIYRKYSKFLNVNLLNRSAALNDDDLLLKKWSFSKFDLNKCFDSIGSKELINYVGELFGKELGTDFVFTLMRFCKLQFDVDQKQLKIKYDYVTLKHAFHEKGFLNGIMDYIGVLERFSLKNKNECTVFVPQSIHDRNITAKKLKDSLKRCLEHIVIKIHNELYERMNGILQGSICSRNLCDLYLGRIEKELFYYDESSGAVQSQVTEKRMKLNRSDEVIMRIVDDYLVICPNQERLLQINDLLKNQFNLNDKKTVKYLWTKSITPIRVIKNESDLIMDYKDSSDPFKLDTTIDLISPSGLAAKPSIDFLSNHSGKLFPWCGINIDLATLDVYLNYDKYFEESANLKNRLNSSNDYKNVAFLSFNAKFLRLFSLNLSSLVLDNKRVNNLQAILRNFVDFFALSCIRFFLFYNIRAIPSQILRNVHFQLRIIVNLCYCSNNKISSSLRNELLTYFYSAFALFKFLCFRTYSSLIKHFKLSKHVHLLRLIEVNLTKINFSRCIKFNAESYFSQLENLIDQQIQKFYKCNI